VAQDTIIVKKVSQKRTGEFQLPRTRLLNGLEDRLYSRFSASFPSQICDAFGLLRQFLWTGGVGRAGLPKIVSKETITWGGA
jgi:hypothetical protein